MSALYMVDTRTGEQSLISTTIMNMEVETEPIPDFLTKGFNVPVTATFTAKLDSHTFLSILLGHKVTNNWLKRHGGVMSRKIPRRYK